MLDKLYDPRYKFARWLLLALLGFIASAQAQQSQTFSSGSTGADGALDYSNLPAGTVVLFDPTKFNPPIDPSGDNIFNFTTINIPTGVTVGLSGRILKGPVYWLASGDVTINGRIELSGESGRPPTPTLDGRIRAMPGPGGFSGGVGGKQDPSSASTLAASPVAQPGDGPGGGPAAAVSGFNCGGSSPNSGGNGRFTGNSFLVPLIGGSGGGGGNMISSPLSETPYGAGGGAGGGAILIASSTSISVNGIIAADGGNGGVPNCNGAGGLGSGGAIRLVAPTLTLGNNNAVHAVGGFNPSDAANGNSGVIRLEAFTFNTAGFSLNNNSFLGTPFTLGSPFSTFVPATGPPSVAIASVNGVNVSQTPAGILANPDVSIDTTSPVQMTIQASFIPPGTVITLHVFSDNGTDQTVQTTPLQGTLQSSTATATVTFPSGFSFNFVKATWTQ
jgi:hypothetical protein